MNKHTVKRVVLLSFSLIHLVFWSMAYSSIQHEVNETRSAKNHYRQVRGSGTLHLKKEVRFNNPI